MSFERYEGTHNKFLISMIPFTVLYCFMSPENIVRSIMNNWENFYKGCVNISYAKIIVVFSNGTPVISGRYAFEDNKSFTVIPHFLNFITVLPRYSYFQDI